MPRGQRAIRGLGGRGGDRGRGGQGGRYSNRAMASSLSDSSSDDDDDVHARSLKAPKQIPQELFNDEGSYPDIKLIVDGETFFAHKCILAKQSDFFATMFQSGMRESAQRDVVLKDVGREAFYIALQHIYSIQVNIELDTILQVYQAARIYCLQDLQKKSQFIASEIDDRICWTLIIQIMQGQF